MSIHGSVWKIIRNSERFQVLYMLAFVLFGYSCTDPVPTEIREAQNELPEVLDYNFHVKPILSDNCFACHGPDAANQKAGLRLDIPDGATAPLESNPGNKAIVPGDLSKSEAFRRMISTDPETMMPPPESHLSLTKKEIAILSKWIEEGAEYKKHWSFIPLQQVEVPKASIQSDHPIDQFIAEKLADHGLSFSGKASKESLIRRTSFTLTGLPPKINEIDQFLNDKGNEAYEKLIDRWLASPTYGEHMAANWMDVARYADSDGYLDDKHRRVWPYRDWVIGAFNDNLSYKDFVTLQLAGDLLPDASPETVLPTAFNRLHRRNSEAGIVFEEYRVEYNADRTNTLGKAFLGLSLECARCHDHKYDPISQKEYYSVFGFFNSTNEMGTAVYGPDITPSPALLLAEKVEEKELKTINQYIQNLEQQQKEIVQEFKGIEGRHIDDETLRKQVSRKLAAHYPMESESEKNVKGGPAKYRNPVFAEGKHGKAFFTNDYNSVTLGDKVGWYKRMEPFTVELWVYPDTVYHDSHLFWHCETLRLGLKGYTLSLSDNHLKFSMSHTWPHNAIQVTSKTAIPAKEWSHIIISYDGSSKAGGIELFINGDRQPKEIDIDNLYKGIQYVPNIHTYGFSGFQLGSRDKFIPFKNGGLDEVKIYNGQLSALEAKYVFSQTADVSFDITKADDDLFVEYMLLNEYDPYNQVKSSLTKVYRKHNALINEIPEIMVMGDLPEPRPTYVLNRGNYSDKGEQVSPTTPEAILPFDESLPKNRLGLAKWLFDEKNPLTARVYVNRIWQMHFGTGLVKTSEDFGSQGDIPSHPELLDWLANEFIASGWDIKALHKLILTSDTYRQSSRIKQDLLEIDPENKWLARGPSLRFSAEMIRDNALAISDLLIDSIGGPSVYPYQPEGLWDGLTTKGWAYKYKQSEGEGLYRRTMYTIWKRTAPPPSMLIFDVATRSSCEVRRTSTSTPLQALALLNDPQYMEASRVAAEKVIGKVNEENKRLETVYRLATGKQPDEQDFLKIKDFYKQEYQAFTEDPSRLNAYLSTGNAALNPTSNKTEVAALSVVLNALMNTYEGFTIN